MTFVAPNLACGEARGASARAPAHPPKWGCNRRATKPQAKFGATLRAVGLFRPDFVARSLQIHFGICSSLPPRLGKKSLAANIIVFMPKTAKVRDAMNPGPCWADMTNAVGVNCTDPDVLQMFEREGMLR